MLDQQIKEDTIHNIGDSEPAIAEIPLNCSSHTDN